MGGLIGLPESASSSEIMLLLNSNILREKIIKEYNLMPVLFSDPMGCSEKLGKRSGFSLNPLTWISKLITVVKPADKKGVKKSRVFLICGMLYGRSRPGSDKK